MKRKRLPTGVKDQIEFGLDLGYFNKVQNQVFMNPNSEYSFEQFNRKYQEYLK